MNKLLNYKHNYIHSLAKSCDFKVGIKEEWDCKTYSGEILLDPDEMDNADLSNYSVSPLVEGSLFLIPRR